MGATTKGTGNTKMKNKIFTPALTLLIAALMIAVMPTDAQAAVYDDTVRLHILANSDSDEDQALKYEIRDEVLDEYGGRLSSISSANEAEQTLSGVLDEIELFCEEQIRMRGYSYNVEVSIGKEWYDTREYEDFTLPKGIYTSLRIIIGEGEGRNWWCVMYPPLCLDAATESAPVDDAVKKYTDEEFTLITSGGYNVKFKMLELISDAFSQKH